MSNVNAILKQIEANPEFDRASAPYNHPMYLSRKGKIKKMIRNIEEITKQPAELYVIKIDVGQNWFLQQAGGYNWILTRTEISRLRAALIRAQEKGAYPVVMTRSIIKYQPIVNFVK
ncbi:hypothetical protein TOTORO_00420 [Serratia phage vB_SmaS-Totoro]|nr:hypothetical protein TOTORO_00420 [Serratia phage vB_SmaS-Totoro]